MAYSSAEGILAKKLEVGTFEKQDYIDTLLETASPSLTSWLGKTKLADNYDLYVSRQIEWLQDEEFANSFCQSCSVLNKEPSAFLNRLVVLGEEEQCIAGIRFLGMDLDKPFVDILPNFAIDEQSTLRLVKKEINTLFSDFKPLAMRLLINNYDALAMWQKHGATVDLYYVAGSIQLLRQGLMASHAKVSIVPARSLDFYDEYLSIFKRFHLKNGDLAIHVTPESRQDLLACKEEGGLFLIKVEDKWAGVLAAQRSRESGLSGFLVREEILREEYRGKKLAPVAMGQLIHKLPAAADDLLFGTIHPMNTPSLKTAKSVGREIVSAYVFVGLT